MTLYTLTCFISEAKVIKLPHISAANVSDFDVTEVEHTKTATRLHVVAIVNREVPASEIANGTYLLAGGRKYAMTRLEKPDEGKPCEDEYDLAYEFDLWFEPLPKDTKTFDFIEGEGGEGRKLWDVDLTGKKKKVPAILNAKESSDAGIPDFKLEVDSVTVNLHILNYRPKMGNRVTYFVNFLTGQFNKEDELPKAHVDAEGNCTIRLLATGTGEFIFVSVGDNSLYAVARVAPGEVVDVWADAEFSGYKAMYQRKNLDHERIWSISNGCYRYLDLAELKNMKSYHGMQLHTGWFADYHMTADEYTDHIINMYNDSLARIKADRRLTHFQREVACINLAADLIAATTNRDYLLEHNYWAIHKNYGQSVPVDSIRAIFTTAHTRRVAEVIDINDPALLLQALGKDLATPIFKEAGIDDRQLYPLSLFLQQYEAAGANDTLDEAALNKLENFNIPFYTQLVMRRHDEMLARLGEYDTGMVMNTPAVPDDEVFDAIIAPYKGKVVVIDVWNTWCGPCRAAIKQHEPLKTTSLSDEDIVWIYLADESSPKDVYTQMVQDIAGIHYRLPKSQSHAVANRFGIGTIPSYILVDREGNAALRNDMRDDKAFVRIILEKL